MPRVIQKYIGKEILAPFLLSVSVFTLVLFMQNALDLSEMLITRGVGISHFLRIIAYTLPSLLWLSIPMAFLMAVLIGLGRLSTDNEIIAMQSVGIGAASFLRPVLSMGTVLFVMTLLIGTVGVPWGGSALNRLMYQILQQSATAGIHAKTFNDRFSDLVIYAESVDPEKSTISKVIIADYRGDLAETILARSGTIKTDPRTLSNRLTLSSGSVHEFDPGQGRYRLIHFEEYTLSLASEAESERRLMEMSEKDPEEMSLVELSEAAKSGTPEETRLFRMHYHEKFSLPFSCMVFGLLSVPLGIRLKRSGKFIGFAWSLLIVFLYYILLGTGRNFGSEGVIPAALAAWLPNLVFAVLGGYLMLQSSRKIIGVSVLRTRLARITKRIMHLLRS